MLCLLSNASSEMFAKKEEEVNMNVNNSKILLVFLFLFLGFLRVSKILIFLKQFKKYQKYPNS